LRERFTSPPTSCSAPVPANTSTTRLRRRYKKARDAAMRQDRDMESLRFHDLRHTFGTLAASRFDAVNLQAMLGHADSRTTARYLHARPTAEDADRLTQIFGRAAAGAAVITAAPEQT
jgi:integrase